MIDKNHPCYRCIYLSKLSSGYTCCNYIFMEDKRRPCPPGEGCTVKITDKEVKKRKTKERKEMSVEAMQRKKERDRLYWERWRENRRKTCRRCGLEFHPVPGNYSFCSEECRAAQAKENRRMADKRQEEKRKAAKEKKNEGNA